MSCPLAKVWGQELMLFFSSSRRCIRPVSGACQVQNARLTFTASRRRRGALERPLAAHDDAEREECTAGRGADRLGARQGAQEGHLLAVDESAASRLNLVEGGVGGCDLGE